MKKTGQLAKVILLSLFLMVFAQNASAQKVTLSFQNETFEKVLNSIKKQTGLSLVFSEQLVDLNRKVSINANSIELNDVLKQLLAETNLGYEIKNNKLYLVEKKVDELKEFNRKSKKITGLVTDEKGDPIIGASVIEFGTSKGTVTDIKGNFTIDITGQSTLAVSYIGYKQVVVKTGMQNYLKVILYEDTKILDEVVVIGYGVRKKVTLSGSVGTLEGKKLGSQAFSNVSQALQGQIPGLVVNRSGGAPGRGASIQIRGISSLNGGSPLILIDGAEGDINSLNAADIDNISVLKDGTAAIYGARASDGVILITTRNGSKGKPVISLNSYYAIKKASSRRETVSLYEYAVMGKDAASDGSAQPGGFGYEYATDGDLEKILANDPNPEMKGIWGQYPKFFQNQNWYDQLIKNGNLQNYNIDISGGSEKATYLFSGSFQNEDGIVKLGYDNYKRYNVRSKIDVNLLSNLILRTNISYAADNRLNSVNDYFFGALNQMRCWAPIYNPAGNFYRFQNYPQVAQMVVEGGKGSARNSKLSSNIKLEYEVIKGLKVIGQSVVTTSQNYGTSYSRAYEQYDWENNIYPADISQNASGNSYSRNKYGNFSGLIDFNRDFGRHNISTLLGTSLEQNSDDNFSAWRQNFTNNELFALDLGDPTKQYANGSGSDWAILSYFGRLGYVFNKRYILDASFRYDGSSRFDPNHRWGLFPGVSTAWVLSEESFVKKLKVFDQFKLRASYGKMGNQSGIGLYDYFETITSPTSSGYYPFGLNGSMTTASRPSGMVSLSRTWESIYTANLGVDISILKNRLNLSLDVFRKRNSNMLVAVSYPSVIGASAPYTNNGTLEVKGFEASLSWRDNLGKDFDYAVTLTLSDATNKIVKLGGVSTFGEGLNGAVQGYSTNSYFGFISDGYIQTDEDRTEYLKIKGVLPDVRLGDLKYKDIDGDGKLTYYGDGADFKGDMTYLGNSNPRYNFGANISLSYKGFDFSAFIQGTVKRSVMLDNINGVPYWYPWYDPARYFYGNTWTAENVNAKYPRLTFNTNVLQWNYRVSDHRIINGAYARLKNLQIGYTLPKEFTSKIQLQNLRIYFSGTDLFEIHNMPVGYDPEDPSTGLQYPFTRFYSIGLNLKF